MGTTCHGSAGPPWPTGGSGPSRSAEERGHRGASRLCQTQVRALRKLGANGEGPGGRVHCSVGTQGAQEALKWATGPRVGEEIFRVREDPGSLQRGRSVQGTQPTRVRSGKEHGDAPKGVPIG